MEEPPLTILPDTSLVPLLPLMFMLEVVCRTRGNVCMPFKWSMLVAELTVDP